MKNVWLDRSIQRKTFVLGDWVVLDRRNFEESLYDQYIQSYGSEPFQVMSLPYVEWFHCGLTNIRIDIGRIDIGRLGQKSMSVCTKNLVKVSL